MATHDYVISNASGAAVRADLNNALAAIVTNNSSATAPTTTYAYQWWADTGSSPAVMKLRNAANSAWITLFQLDGEWSTIALENGTAAAPSLYFKDSGTDTGFFSGGTDQVNVTTAGIERVEWGASEVVFNDGGENYDFRIEGDTNSSLFFVDASADKVGIGTTSPGSLDPGANNLVVGSGSGEEGLTVYTGNASRGIINFADGTSGIDTYVGQVAYDHAANAMTFGTSATERARIDSSGRLLVGTSTSQGKFYNTTGIDHVIQVEGQYYCQSWVANAGTVVTGGAYLTLGRSRGTTTGSVTAVASGDKLGVISFQGADGTDFVDAARIDVEVDGTPGANDMPGRIVFSTTADGASSPTERMRIDNQGSIWTRSSTSASGSIIAATDTGAGTTFPIYAGRRNATGITSGTDVFYVFSNGNVQNTNGSYTTISDAKLKENIVDATSQWNDLKAIQIRNWNFKAETGHETHRQIGPIAQELETVCPGLVFETPDRDAEGNETGEVTKGVNQSVLYMKAVKALQEAMERIEQLEAKVAALEAA